MGGDTGGGGLITVIGRARGDATYIVGAGPNTHPTGPDVGNAGGV